MWDIENLVEGEGLIEQALAHSCFPTDTLHPSSASHSRPDTPTFVLSHPPVISHFPNENHKGSMFFLEG